MFLTFKWKLKTRFHYVLWLPLGNLLGCLSLKYLRKNFLFCMRFSRYMFIWLFYQPSKTKRLFNLRSLVKPVIYNSASPLKQVNTFIPVRRVLILLRARTCLFYIKSKCFLFLFRQPPALPCRLQQSTIGRLGLNHRVRDENGCVP